MGTGITTGPYSITAGQTLVLNDPATWSIASEAVQIQNNTGYNVFVQSAGAGYNIQPFTASTIPCAGGQTLVAVVSSTANVGTGLLSAVWLLPGQDGPMPDGPMTIYPKTPQAVTVTVGTVPGGNNYNLSGFTSGYSTVTLYYSGSVPGNSVYLWNASSGSGNVTLGPVSFPPSTTTLGVVNLTGPSLLLGGTTLYLLYPTPYTFNYVLTSMVGYLSATQSQ